MKTKINFAAVFFLAFQVHLFGQRVPGDEENFDYLVTTGKDCDGEAGDDDHVQIIFFKIPISQTAPFYIRIFDPNCGGLHDSTVGDADTKTRFSLYAGKDAFSEDSRRVNPIGNYKSGDPLFSRVFGNEKANDDTWVTSGPISPNLGYYSEVVDGRIFKLIVEGIQGNDSNYYRCFLSSYPNKNIPLDEANIFAYEYTVKLPISPVIGHAYPYIDKSVISITEYNFNLNKESEVLIYTVAKNRHVGCASGSNRWCAMKWTIETAETNATIDIQFLKTKFGGAPFTFYVTNQVGEVVPFFAIPIGSAPSFKYDIKVNFN